MRAGWGPCCLSTSQGLARGWLQEGFAQVQSLECLSLRGKGSSLWPPRPCTLPSPFYLHPHSCPFLLPHHCNHAGLLASLSTAFSVGPSCPTYNSLPYPGHFLASPCLVFPFRVLIVRCVSLRCLLSASRLEYRLLESSAVFRS